MKKKRLLKSRNYSNRFKLNFTLYYKNKNKTRYNKKIKL